MSSLESLAKVRNKSFCHVKLKNTIAYSDWSSRWSQRKYHPSSDLLINRSIDQSISQPASQWVSQWVSQSVSQSVNHLLEARSKYVRTHKKGYKGYNLLENSPKKYMRWLVKIRVYITRLKHRTSTSYWRNDGASKENLHFDAQSKEVVFLFSVAVYIF